MRLMEVDFLAGITARNNTYFLAFASFLSILYFFLLSYFTSSLHFFRSILDGTNSTIKKGTN